MTAVVAAAVKVAPPVEAEFNVVMPVRAPMDVLAAIAPPEISSATSMLVTVEPVGATSACTIAAVLKILRVSTPAPPSIESPRLNVADGPVPAYEPLKVSLPSVPVRLSAPAVSDLVSIQAKLVIHIDKLMIHFK
jgi:hypothetical protein